MFMFGFADMLAAAAATRTKTASGIEWVVEGRHEASCTGIAPYLSKAHASLVLQQLR
jgi:hypothetical protein